MKKINLFGTLSVVLCASCLIMTPAFSEDNIFGDLSTTPPNVNEMQQPTVKVEQPVTVRGTTQMAKQETLTTQSLQNTVSSLEAAQTDLRTKLETAQNNFNTVNAEYQRVKQERAALRKIVKKTESRLKTLEKTKKNIQKAMNTEL